MPITRHCGTASGSERMLATSFRKQSDPALIPYSIRSLPLAVLQFARLQPSANNEEEILMSEQNLDQAAAVALLNEILETELAGVVRYTHYALMVFGHSRIPIVSWLRSEATTCLE